MSLFAKTQHIDELNNMIHCYGDTYEAFYAAAEEMYFYQHGKLPEWAVYIERVETVNGSHIFIHRDRNMAQ